MVWMPYFLDKVGVDFNGNHTKFFVYETDFFSQKRFMHGQILKHHRCFDVSCYEYTFALNELHDTETVAIQEHERADFSFS
jgi:hypothetical protein